MTAAQIICDVAGLSVQEVCNRACISEGRSSGIRGANS
jgi:hypothetical protein